MYGGIADRRLIRIQRTPDILRKCLTFVRTADHDGSQFLTDLSGHGRHGMVGSTSGVDSNDPAWLPGTSRRYVYFSGVAGNYVAIPHNPLFNPVGDLTITAFIACSDYTPATRQTILAKTAAGQRCYLFRIGLSGQLSLLASTDGTNFNVSADSTANLLDAPLDEVFVRVTRNASTGDISFYTSSNGEVWEQLGTTLSSTTGTLFASSSDVAIGAETGGTSNVFDGRIYRVTLEDGGTPVLNVDFTDPTNLRQPYTTMLDSVTGATVTLTRTVSSARQLCIVDRPLYLFGVDDLITFTQDTELNNVFDGEFCILAISRGWRPSGSSVTFASRKAAGNIATNPGFQQFLVQTAGTNQACRLGHSDGVTVVNGDSATGIVTATVADGELAFWHAGMKRGRQKHHGVNGRWNAPGIDDTVAGSIANTENLLIGQLSTGVSRAFEFMGYAVLPWVPSEPELRCLWEKMEGA